jgi:hypothetical protein
MRVRGSHNGCKILPSPSSIEKINSHLRSIIIAVGGNSAARSCSYAVGRGLTFASWDSIGSEANAGAGTARLYLAIPSTTTAIPPLPSCLAVSCQAVEQSSSRDISLSSYLAAFYN